MQKIAIIGTGIAGMGAAHFLRHEYDITLFEKNSYAGGHTNTVTIDEEGTPVHIDTGFMVFNQVTYPNLIRLFDELQVPVKKTSMSFSVQHVPTGLEFSGSGLDGLFAQRRNLFSPRYIRMLLQIDRFNKECEEVLTDPRYASMTLAEYAKEKNFGDDFLYKYIIPMSSAVWSTPIDLMLGFPAFSLVRFFKNHGFLGLDTQHQWYTIHNGSRVYRDILLRPFTGRVVVNSGVVRVERSNGKAVIIFADGQRSEFDKVIIAAHADEALAMLAEPTEQERRLLSPFTYQENIAVLHTDASVMPRTRRAWSSWNYRIDQTKHAGLTPSTVYWMNSLQQVSQKKDYFVNINGEEFIEPSRVLRRIVYTHPVYTVAAQQAQKELPQLNSDGPVYFCGSYFKYGFHEDAFTSGLDVSRVLSAKPIWT
ncbi:MAG: FAD-dependent oxidoreductase [Bacteroidetes bacterium]|nr:FAD-dependent oxidoreductase [Bacteroidota bacterium]